MILFRPRRLKGICFAWLPRSTPDGVVWLEWVHFEHSNDGYDTSPWRYRRMLPQELYDSGKRVNWDWDPTGGTR